MSSPRVQFEVNIIYIVFETNNIEVILVTICVNNKYFIKILEFSTLLCDYIGLSGAANRWIRPNEYPDAAFPIGFHNRSRVVVGARISALV